MKQFMKQLANSILVRSACTLALGLAMMTASDFAGAQIQVSITFPPPALPQYEQPVLAEDGAIWVPGYWDYNGDGYSWVPGSWEQPPEVGLLWTPGYWGFDNGGYVWNAGYWGPTIGFYGGIDYGYGYSGHGYDGGHWQGQHFFYNTAVSHVNVTNIRNTYAQTTVNHATISRVSFNGGKGGVMARPSEAEQAAGRAPHPAAAVVQIQHRQSGIAASPERAPQRSAAAQLENRAPVHAANLPAVARQTAPSTGEAERDKVNQQQQDELRDGQEKQRQELQRKQSDDHARAAKLPAASGNEQKLERQHQGQTQALAQRHTSEQNTLRESQQNKQQPKQEPSREAPRGEKQPR
jgi:YXWGXW repeat-containing protein